MEYVLSFNCVTHFDSKYRYRNRVYIIPNRLFFLFILDLLSISRAFNLTKNNMECMLLYAFVWFGPCTLHIRYLDSRQTSNNLCIIDHQWSPKLFRNFGSMYIWYLIHVNCQSVDPKANKVKPVGIVHLSHSNSFLSQSKTKNIWKEKGKKNLEIYATTCIKPNDRYI